MERNIVDITTNAIKMLEFRNSEIEKDKLNAMSVDLGYGFNGLKYLHENEEDIKMKSFLFTKTLSHDFKQIKARENSGLLEKSIKNSFLTSEHLENLNSNDFQPFTKSSTARLAFNVLLNKNDSHTYHHFMFDINGESDYGHSLNIIEENENESNKFFIQRIKRAYEDIGIFYSTIIQEVIFSEFKNIHLPKPNQNQIEQSKQLGEIISNTVLEILYNSHSLKPDHITKF